MEARPALRLRVIDFGYASAIQSHALYHGLAAAFAAGDASVLSLVSPIEPHISIGLHQDLAHEIDEAYCAGRGLPVIRRRLGGGAAYLDRDQLFFHFILPGAGALEPPAALFARTMAPVIETYRTFGIEARYQPPGDIVVGQRKIGACAGAAIGDASVVIGSFMFDFDAATMASALRAPSEEFRAILRAALEERITTMRALLPAVPGRDEVKRRFLGECARAFGLPVEISQPSVPEARAIQAAAEALLEPDSTEAARGPMARHAVKVAEGTVLSECGFKTQGDPVRLVLLEQDGRIAELRLGGAIAGLTGRAMQALTLRLRGTALDAEALRRGLAREAADLRLALPPPELEQLARAIEAARRQQ
ncbi:MAG: lipoate--protein ligase family protein [Proteobacteria bacterium]|nr:lipoate--protein ligase family protein [Pseudomonadota bacterium]MBI3499548.1 lipoate--protein ligase family protein [Pseudomonadota bacterium]